jgi:hypothetical protein
MDAYNHTQAIDRLRRSIDAIANDGHLPLRNFARPIRERNSGPCGPYYFTPGKLITDARSAPEGFGGYLNKRADEISEGSFTRLRVKRADEIIRLDHTGWYADDDGIGDTMFGVVATLPRSRGFLAGWSLGAQMATSFSRTIYETAEEAARAADREAEHASERERDYQREQRAEEAQAEREENQGAATEWAPWERDYE